MSRNREQELPTPPFKAIVCAGAERATGKLAPQEVNGRRVYQGPVSYYLPAGYPEEVLVILRDGDNLYVQPRKGRRFWVRIQDVIILGSNDVPLVVQHSFFDSLDDM